ncbi:MAG: thymidine phosphorylase [Actinomycetota bacterium]
MDARDAVVHKRDGKTLTEDEIRAIVLGVARGEVGDEVAAAFLMACFIRGLNEEETVALTRAMVDSGRTLTLDGAGRPTIDKHSTGGVSDGVTLGFAPLVASLGFAVAKLSGRGLGHTGGTLDKLESIPGFRTDLAPQAFERQVYEVGCAVAAQSPDLVPADGKLYALRDATATVASIPLIAASVMSKKLAVETDLILLDVKVGGGAFTKTFPEAEALGIACAELAVAWGRRVRIAVSDMSQPLGAAVGNALEIKETISLLRGEQGGRLLELVLEFAGQAQAAMLGRSQDDGRAAAQRVLSSGEALESFRRMVEAQGGDPRVVDDPQGVLPRAPVARPILAERAGVLRRIDAEAVGSAAVRLGAGRIRKGDLVNPATGLILGVKVGDSVQRGDEIGEVHARDGGEADEVARAILATLELGEDTVEPPPLVYGWREVEPPG